MPTVPSRSDYPDFLPHPLANLLNQPQSPQARVAILADDDVIVHGDAERLRYRDDAVRHVDVGARGRWIAGGMVVHQPT